MKYNFFKNYKMISVFLMIILIFFICFPQILSQYDPNFINMENRMSGISSIHFLGTDLLGRDLFTRILYGGRISIVLAIIATFISLMIGLIIGIISGYYSGVIDIIVTCITGIFQGLPNISIMIVIASFMGANIYSLIIALTINSWMSFSRIVRAMVLKLKEENFIKILKMYGASDFNIIVKHIIPNFLPDMLVLFTTKIVSNLLSIAGLSFLGIGIQPPTPDWGSMISDGMSFFISKPILVIAPGICILIISMGVNHLGEILKNKYHISSVEGI